MKKMSKLTWFLIITALVVVGVVIYKKRKTSKPSTTGIGEQTGQSNAPTSLRMTNTVAGPLLYRA